MARRSTNESRSRGTRTRMSPEERRAQLLRCALEVFANKGIRRAGHAEVAKLAGCAVSTVFLYFDTREALVDAVLDEVESFYTELAARAHASTRPATEVLLDHGRRFRASIESHPEHALVLLNWAANARSRVWPRYIALIERMVANHRATIERGIAEGDLHPSVDAESAARIIIGYAQMSIQMRLADFEPERAEQISSRMIAAVLAPVNPQENAA